MEQSVDAGGATPGAITPGFNDAVHDAQRMFSGIMHAMARPGRAYVPTNLPSTPAPLYDTVGAVLLTLADYDTSLFYDQVFQRDYEEADLSAGEWVAFHTGAPVSKTQSKADLVITSNANPGFDFEELALGSMEFPDRSATLIWQVESISGEPQWVLRGPGIEHEHNLNVEGLPEDFLVQWTNNSLQFPCGIDIILCSPDQIVCLPRTVSIEEVV